MERSKFQFKNPTISKLIYEENKNFEKKNFKGMKIESSTKVERLNELSAYVELELIVGDKEDSPFWINIIMGANFEWNDDFEYDLNKMLWCNAPSVLLSYIRPIISNITSNSKYPTLNVPFMNFSNNDVGDN